MRADMASTHPSGEDTFASRIPHLLLLAGPSGAGKTTFVRQLCQGSLPTELQTRLPPDVRDWDRIEGNRFLKRGTQPVFSSTSSQGSRGLIVHYDIVHIHRLQVPAYASDPVFTLVGAADQLGIVNVRPSPTQLLAQFASRESEIYARKGPLHGTWRSVVLGPLARVSHWARGQKALDKRSLYGDVGWLEACYAQWDRFMDTLPANLRVSVEPAFSADGMPTFQLVKRA